MNPSIRRGEHIERTSSNPSTYELNVGNFDDEGFEQNDTYAIEDNIRKFFTKPLVINDTDIYDNRVYYSELKINGETSDSWGSYKILNYWDVEGSYGPINALITLQDKMYYLQDRGFGVLVTRII